MFIPHATYPNPNIHLTSISTFLFKTLNHYFGIRHFSRTLDRVHPTPVWTNWLFTGRNQKLQVKLLSQPCFRIYCNIRSLFFFNLPFTELVFLASTVWALTWAHRNTKKCSPSMFCRWNQSTKLSDFVPICLSDPRDDVFNHCTALPMVLKNRLLPLQFHSYCLENIDYLELDRLAILLKLPGPISLCQGQNDFYTSQSSGGVIRHETVLRLPYLLLPSPQQRGRH